MDRRITSIDVAQAAGVSQSTVSRTYSGATVSSGTRAKVLQAAAQLGYNPNAIARSLSTQRSQMVGVVMGSMDSPFNPYALELFTQRLQANGQQVLFFSVPADQDIDTILPRVLQYQVDALIITSMTLSSEMAKVCAQQGTPVLLFNRTVPGSLLHVVGCNNQAGGAEAANLLLDSGHQHLAYIAGPENTSTSRERISGFVEELKSRGYMTILTEEAHYTYQSGAVAGRRLLLRDDPPDAIFCVSDIIALGVLDQARSMSISIPDELSIIGFDDIPAASWTAYNLTTIRLPINRMVDASLTLLQRMIDEPQAQPETLLFPGTLVQRGTVRGNL